MIEDLVRVDRLVRRAHLAGEHDHRRALHQRSGDAGDGVGKAGTQRRNQHRRRAGELIDGIRHERRGRLALRQHELDPGILAGADRLEHVVAGDAEGEADAIGVKGAGDRVGDLHHSISL